MDLDSAMVGRVVATASVTVDFRACALYAAAIGAERDAYLDDRTPGGALAPPAFVTSLEWPLVSGPGVLGAIGLPASQLFGRLLHMFQDSTFFSPIRAGARLNLELSLEAASETRSGASVSLRIRTSDAQTMAPVAESWFGAYFRNMKVAVPRVAHAAPAIVSPKAHGPVHRQDLTISRTTSHIYDECARLRNPIHTELSFATGLGLPDIALHGTLLWAKLGELAIDRYLGGDPTGLRRLASRFRRPILPNRTLSLETSFPTCDAARRVGVNAYDAESGELLSEGYVQLASVS